MKNLVPKSGKSPFLALLFLLSLSQLHAQYVWRAQSNPGSLSGYSPVAIGLTQLNNGKILTLTSRQANQEYTLIHLDANGNLVKAVTRTGGVTDLNLFHILATSDGGYLYSGTAYISGVAHTYVAKYNASDAYQWSMAVDHPNREHEWGIHAIEVADGYAITGQVYKPYNFPNPEEYYVTLFKVTTAGAFDWARRYETLAQVEGVEVAETPSPTTGYAIAARRFSSTSYTGLKYYQTGPFGHILWAYNYGSNLRTETIAAESGSLYLAGYSSTNGDMYLLKMDNNGNITWGKHISDATGRDLAPLRMVLTSDEIRVVGKINQFSGANEPFMMSLDKSTGDVNWSKEYNFPTALATELNLILTLDGGMAFSATHSGTTDPIRVIKTDAVGYSGCLEEEFEVNNVAWTPTRTAMPEDESAVTNGTTQTRTWNLAIGSTDVTCCDIGNFCTSAVAPNDRFQHSLGTDGEDAAYSVHVYPNSTVLIGGVYYNPNSGARDQLLMRSDENGSLCMSYLLDQGAKEWALDAIQSESDCGDYYAAGFQDLGSSTYNAILTSMDIDGNALFSKVLPEDDWGQAYEVVQLSNGDLVLCGFTSANTNGGEDMLLARFDNSGNMIWSHAIGTEDMDRAYAMAVADDGFVLVGETEPEFSRSLKQIYVVKTDFNGIPQWSRIYGTERNDLAHDVVIDKDGKIYLTGYTMDENQERDAYLSRISSTGTVEYFSRYLLDKQDEAYALALHPTDDYVYLAGYSDVFSSSLGTQAYSIVTNKNGAIVYANTYGGAGREVFQGVDVTDDDEAIFVGNNTSFAPSAVMDVYMVKIDATFHSCLYETRVYPLGESILPDPLNDVSQLDTDPWDDNPNALACPDDHLIDICAVPEFLMGEEEGDGTQKTQLEEKIGSLEVYPNPATHSLNLRFASLEQASGQLRLTDLQGRTVLTRPVQEVELQLDVQSLQSGVYFLNFQNGNERIVHKVVIQH